MKFKAVNLSILLVMLAWLTGCAEPVISPVEQIRLAQKQSELAKPKTPVATVAKTQTSTRFLCDNGKEVRVTYAQKTTAKSKTITVNFENVSHRLTPVVTRNGKKYSNIRWTWQEPRSGKAMLTNNNKKVLAANCVKK